MGFDRPMILIVALSVLSICGCTAIPSWESSAGTNCSYSNISIHSIQGEGHKSPLVGCYVSEIQGIVTLNTSIGFYIQDWRPDSKKITSEGILVYTKSPPRDVKKGDLAYVSGTVAEYQSQNNSLSLTEIINPLYNTTHVNGYMAPVQIGTGGLIQPDTVIEDDAFGDIALNGSFDPDFDGMDFYESMEGMLVKINNAVVVGPGKPDKSRHVTVYVIGDNGSLAGTRTPRGGVVLRPGDQNPERIALDFFSDSSDPVNVGDRIAGPIVGVIGYSNRNYGIIVDRNTPLKVTHSNSTLADVAENVTIATFNVENLAPKSGRTKFKMLAQQIVGGLGAPNIIALEEIMGDGSANDGSDIYKTLNLLALDIGNLSNGEVRYSNISIPDKTSDRNIVILYRTDKGVSFQGLSAGDPTGAVAVISGPHLSPNPGWINPKNTAFYNSRKPLAAEFNFNGRRLFVIANHFKSKIEDDPLYGEHQPPRRITEDQRHKQARIVHGFVEEILKFDPKANVVVVGDFNDFQFSETLNILKGVELHNPLEDLPTDEQYTYNFEGNSQAIDHILISENLLSMHPEFRVVRINSDFGNQTSDHDPVTLRMKLP